MKHSRSSWSSKLGSNCSACCRLRLTSARYSQKNRCSNPQHRKFYNLQGMQYTPSSFGWGKSELDRSAGTFESTLHRKMELGTSRSIPLTTCERSTAPDSSDTSPHRYSHIGRTLIYSCCRLDTQCKWRTVPDKFRMSLLSCYRRTQPRSSLYTCWSSYQRSKGRHIAWHRH